MMVCFLGWAPRGRDGLPGVRFGAARRRDTVGRVRDSIQIAATRDLATVGGLRLIRDRLGRGAETRELSVAPERKATTQCARLESSVNRHAHGCLPSYLGRIAFGHHGHDRDSAQVNIGHTLQPGGQQLLRGGADSWAAAARSRMTVTSP